LNFRTAKYRAAAQPCATAAIQFAQRNFCSLRNRSRSTGIIGHGRRNTQRCAEDSKLNKVWIYGKMLIATLLIKRTDEKFGVGGLEPKRQRDVTPWRFWNMTKQEVMSIVLAINSWNIEQYPQAK
jgi:hypothetical protein